MDAELKVLIVEDMVTIRLLLLGLLKVVLKNRRLAIFEASDGKEGLELARRVRPNVILSDIDMPGLTGIELCRQVKAEADLKSAAVILITSMLEHRREGLEASASAFINKPISAKDLQAALSTALEGTA